MIADCFIFYNELAQLEIRLHELAPVVDRFVLLEARQTFTGKDKPLVYAENKDRFAAYADKIKHVVLDRFPPTENPWDREHYQRNALAEGVADLAPDHLVMLSDVDEIPRRATLQKILASGEAKGAMTALGLAAHSFKIDLRVPNTNWWLGSRIVEKRCFASPQSLRNVKLQQSKRAPWLAPVQRRLQTYRKLGAPLPIRQVPDAGWHITWLGDYTAFIEKMNAFSHQEFNTAELTDPKRFERVATEGIPLFEHIDPRRLEIAPLEDLPLLVQADPNRFASMMVDKAAWRRNTART